MEHILNIPKMKLFEITVSETGEKEWVSGITIIHALKTYLSMTGVDVVDFDDKDNIVEVPKEKWTTMFVKLTDYDNPNNPSYSFISLDEWMMVNRTSTIIDGLKRN